MKVSPDHWSRLFGSIPSGSVASVEFRRVDSSALDAGAFLDAVCSHGLGSVVVQRSVLPHGFDTDDLLRASVAKGLLELLFQGNISDAPPGLSDDAVLDYFFRADAARGHVLHLTLDGPGVTEMFFKKCFEVSTCFRCRLLLLALRTFFRYR